MWIHVFVLAGMAALGVLIFGGRLPKQEILTRREWKLLLLLLAAGNRLGAYLTYTQNGDCQWEEDMYFEKNAAGEGSYEEKMQARVGGEQASVYVRIPEQTGEKTEDDEQEPEITVPGLNEQLQQAVDDYNDKRQEDDKYYLPQSLEGQRIVWSRPWDTSGNIVVALCVAGACCIPIQKQKNNEKMRRERYSQMLLDYPNLITRLSLLIEAGMTVRRALGKIALDYKRKRGRDVRYAYEELLKSYYEMESGVMEKQAYENFGTRCGHPKYRTLAALLAQNLKRGNRRLLEMLERESTEAFEERKRYARVQGETAAAKLLIPMVLQLVIVLVILIVPACMSFYQT